MILQEFINYRGICPFCKSSLQPLHFTEIPNPISINNNILSFPFQKHGFVQINLKENKAINKANLEILQIIKSCDCDKEYFQIFVARVKKDLNLITLLFNESFKLFPYQFIHSLYLDDTFTYVKSFSIKTLYQKESINININLIDNFTNNTDLLKKFKTIISLS